jgi:hypothetical protein
MNLKEFLKPDWKKIILFLISLILTSVISNFGFGIWWSGADIGINYGFPLSFYGYGGGPPLRPDQPIPTYFNFVGLIGDIIFWYVVSYLIIWVYEKMKKKK